ncbi:hypothetical protein B0H14DRAFT_2607632 [Mycena olivaceomarginata]|nr:hypothetical protein B0H14DRAFT_2607632 [Mycena olivaceomarginata]
MSSLWVHASAFDSPARIAIGWRLGEWFGNPEILLESCRPVLREQDEVKDGGGGTSNSRACLLLLRPESDSMIKMVVWVQPSNTTKRAVAVTLVAITILSTLFLPSSFVILIPFPGLQTLGFPNTLWASRTSIMISIIRLVPHDNRSKLRKVPGNDRSQFFSRRPERVRRTPCGRYTRAFLDTPHGEGSTPSRPIMGSPQFLSNEITDAVTPARVQPPAARFGLFGQTEAGLGGVLFARAATSTVHSDRDALLQLGILSARTSFSLGSYFAIWPKTPDYETPEQMQWESMPARAPMMETRGRANTGSTVSSGSISDSDRHKGKKIHS